MCAKYDPFFLYETAGADAVAAVAAVAAVPGAAGAAGAAGAEGAAGADADADADAGADADADADVDADAGAGAGAAGAADGVTHDDPAHSGGCREAASALSRRPKRWLHTGASSLAAM